MPFRVAEYSAFLLRTICTHQLPFTCMVIYLDPKVYRHDPGRIDLSGPFGWSHRTEYQVLKLWEMDPAPILAMASPGLLRFVPLMRGQPEALVVESARRLILTPASTAGIEDKRELLKILSSLATRVVQDPSRLQQLLKEAGVMENNDVYEALSREVGEIFASRRAATSTLAR